MQSQGIAKTKEEKIIDLQKEKEKLEESKYHHLYVARQAFEDSMIDLQMLGNFLLGEALDDPEVIEEVIKINRQISKIFLSSDLVCEVTYRKKNELFK